MSLLTKFGVIKQHCIVESVVLKEGGKQIYLNWGYPDTPEQLGFPQTLQTEKRKNDI